MYNASNGVVDVCESLNSTRSPALKTATPATFRVHVMLRFGLACSVVWKSGVVELRTTSNWRSPSLATVLSNVTWQPMRYLPALGAVNRPVTVENEPLLKYHDCDDTSWPNSLMKPINGGPIFGTVNTVGATPATPLSTIGAGSVRPTMSPLPLFCSTWPAPTAPSNSVVPPKLRAVVPHVVSSCTVTAGMKVGAV